MPNFEILLPASSNYTPGGAQTLSKMACRYPAIYPKILAEGDRGCVWDDKGTKYIDLIAGLGAVSVGYSDYAIDEAVLRQLNRGVSFSLPTALEYEAAKYLTNLIPGTDMWKFGKNGTDGTVMAVRAARAYTERENIVTVGYNGCADVFEICGTRNAGIPKNLRKYVHRAVYNDLVSFLKSESPACVLLEPMVFEYPKEDFLLRLRKVCDEIGALLILDEVVTGGRFEGFTASSYFGVVPDLYVLSKGIANGFPLCAVGGTRRIMSTFERNDFFASGTFGGETISLAAFMATVPILQNTISRRLKKGTEVKECFNNTFKEAVCEGHPTRLNFKFPTEVHKYLFWQEMCKRGVLVGYTTFIMADHTDEDVDQICKAIEQSVKVLDQFWAHPSEAIIGPMPVPAIRTN